MNCGFLEVDSEDCRLELGKKLVLTEGQNHEFGTNHYLELSQKAFCSIDL